MTRQQHTHLQQKQWGVTQPISTSESSDAEKKVTVTLMEELRRQGTFESEEDSRTRFVGLHLHSVLSFRVMDLSERPSTFVLLFLV